GGRAVGERLGAGGGDGRYEPARRGGGGGGLFRLDPPGRPGALERHRDPVPGLGLRLSLDLGFQQHLSDALAAGIAGSGGDLGAAVALDPKTGQVLAMASLPAQDNAAYGPPVDEGALEAARTAP